MPRRFLTLLVIGAMGFVLWWVLERRTARDTTSALSTRAAPALVVSPVREVRAEPTPAISLSELVGPKADSARVKTLHRPNEWKNAGLESPAAALESQYWAMAGGDMNALVKMIVIDAPARELLDELSANLPPRVKAEFNTPERLAALFLLSETTVTDGYVLVDERDSRFPDAKSLVVFTPNRSTGKFDSVTQQFRVASDGNWQRLVSRRMVGGWAEYAKRDAAMTALLRPR